LPLRNFIAKTFGSRNKVAVLLEWGKRKKHEVEN
jgi:hypothetical protein